MCLDEILKQMNNETELKKVMVNASTKSSEVMLEIHNQTSLYTQSYTHPNSIFSQRLKEQCNNSNISEKTNKCWCKKLRAWNQQHLQKREKKKCLLMLWRALASIVFELQTKQSVPTQSYNNHRPIAVRPKKKKKPTCCQPKTVAGNCENCYFYDTESDHFLSSFL